ncbi:MAG TPA: TonB family protein [Thermoanaerobaculia bacterium]|nr:TonB family protein [Thermoanaerobaculia bacterium]
MFASSLFDLQNAKRPRWWILPLSVVLHLLVLVSLVGAQYWQVGPVPEPPLNIVFTVAASLPPAPAGEEAAARQPPVTKQIPKAPQSAPAQPQNVPEELKPPVPPLAETPRETPPAADTATDIGSPNGSKNGVIGAPNGDDTGESQGPSASGPGSQAVAVDGRMRRPQLIASTFVEPRYTEPARRAHLQGIVVLQATIDERGNVIDVRPVKLLPMGLTEEALNAVRQWKFTPATLQGRPVKVFFTLTVNFEVH